MPSPNPCILVINMGLIEEQVLDFFVAATFTPTSSKLENKSLKPNLQPIKLNISVLDIQSSDEEEVSPVDLWKDGKEIKTQSVERVKDKRKGAEPEGSERKITESKEEREEKVKEEKEVKRDTKTLASI